MLIAVQLKVVILCELHHAIYLVRAQLLLLPTACVTQLSCRLLVHVSTPCLSPAVNFFYALCQFHSLPAYLDCDCQNKQDLC